MHVRHERRGQVEILRPKGYLVGGEETAELEQKLKEFIQQKRQHILVNLSAVQHLNPTALGVLINARIALARLGGELVLCGADVRIKNIFTITKLNLIFKSEETEEAAMAAWGAG